MKNSLAGVAGHRGLGHSKRSTKGRFAWVPALILVVGVCLLMTTSPKTASDPVLPAQAGQAPVGQGTLVSGQVNGFSGSYSTSVPIEVIPGRNGLQPALSLSYTSAVVHGLAGTGWGIPVSSIQRLGPGKGSPTYGYEDRFFMSLNGSAIELMPLGPASIQNTYGFREFRTRLESWSRVIAHYLLTQEPVTGADILSDQVAYWEVWSKSGERYYFGPLTDAENDGYSLAFYVPNDPINGSPRRNQWMLRLVEDVDSNSMEYIYSQGTNSPGSLLLTKIQYGGNRVLSGYSHFATVNFVWETRPDQRLSYINGIKQTLGDRLARIESCFGSTVKKSYWLHYDQSPWTEQSRLTSVTLDSPTATYPKIQFEYSDAVGTQPVWWGDTSGTTYNNYPGRAITENFAIADQMAGSSPDGGTFIDVNGDGLPDKLDSYINYNAWSNAEDVNEKTLYLNPGPTGNWEQVPADKLSVPGAPLVYYINHYPFQNGNLDTGVRFADITGDGIPEKIDSMQRSDAAAWTPAVYKGRRDGSGWDRAALGTIVHQEEGLLPPEGCSDQPRYIQYSRPGIDRSGEQLEWKITPRLSNAGGKLLFLWQVCPNMGEDQSYTIQTKLDGVDSDYTPAQPLYDDRVINSVYLGARCFQPLPVKAQKYIFRVRLAWDAAPKSQAAAHAAPQARSPSPDRSKEITCEFHVVASTDLIPPQVHFTQTPPDGFIEDATITWEGGDKAGPVTYATWLAPNRLPLSESADTQENLSFSDMGTRGSFFVVAYDTAGNMTAKEWAYDGGLIKPAIQTIWSKITDPTSGNYVLYAVPQGIDYADVNGDGYADEVTFCQRCTNTDLPNPPCYSALSVRLFSPQRYRWEEAPEWSNGAEPLLRIHEDKHIALDTGVRLQDMNGDGLPDLIRYYYDEGLATNYRWIRYNLGRGWGPQETQASTLAVLPGNPITRYKWQSGHNTSDRGAWLIDINSDGLPDKLDGWKNQDTTFECPSSGWGITPSLNRGTLYEGSGILLPPLSFSESFSPKWGTDSGLLASRDTGARALDMNGDGLPDFVQHVNYIKRNQDYSVYCYNTLKKLYLGFATTTKGDDGLILSPRPEYLVRVTNPIGGITEVRYKAALDSYSRISPATNPTGDYAPSVPYVVESVFQLDGRGNRYKTKYSYAHPKYDIEERQFVGFREMTIIAPDGTSSKTTYHQDFPLTGMVEKSEAFEALDASGASGGPLFQVNTSEYESESDAFGVWRVRKLKDRTKVWENNISLETGVDYVAYDEYDNVLAVKTLGDVNKDDDDKQVQVQYINKKDESNRRWLLGFVQRTDTYSFSAGGGSPVFTGSKRVFYDEGGLGTLLKGHPTREDNWLDVRTDGGIRQSFGGYLDNGRIHYNSDGTLDWRIDAAGIKTTFEAYDPTRRFPLKKIVHGQGGGAYETTVTTDDWGRPLTTTDAKGVMTSVFYDSLGRPTEERIKYPGMGESATTKRYFYNDDSTPGQPERYVETESVLPQDILLHAKAYYDGLGRTYRSETEGWRKQIVNTEVFYDGFGRTQKKSRPHFGSLQPGDLATLFYDLRGRANREEGFGAATETIFHSPLIVETRVTGFEGQDDPIPHKKVTEADAYGRLVWVQHDDMPEMKYTYDVAGALTGAWGKSGDGSWKQFVALTYDAWGHKLTYQDFDAGVTATPTTLTEYFYDISGRLIKQHESVSGLASTWRETALYYAGDLYQLTTRVGTDNTGAPPLTEHLIYYGPNNSLDTGELRTRTDASGVYQFTRAFNSGQQNLVAQTAASVIGTSQTFIFKEFKDTAGRTIKSELPSGESVNWSYEDISGMPSQISDQTGSVLAEYTSYDESHLLEWQRGNGVKSTYARYPLTDRLEKVESTWKANAGSPPELRQSLAYTYYTDGQVAAIADGSSDPYSQSFTYDGALRLKTASSSAKYGVLNFNYDDTVPGGRLEQKSSYTPGTANELVQLIYDEAFAHRVVGTSDGRSFAYDAWGNVVQETKPDGATLLYAYDAWNRMTGVSLRVMTSPGDPRGGTPPVYEIRALASYTYDASGERVQTVKYAGGIADLPLFHFKHVTALGYEVEQMPDSTVKTRWAVPGPHGLVCWKQKITSGAQFFAQVGQSGHSALAGMAWDRLWADSGNLFAGGLQSRLTAAREVAQDAAMLVSHGYGTAATNPNTPGNVAWGGCLLLGLALVILPSTRWGKRLVERLLNAEARRRGERRKKLFTGRMGEEGGRRKTGTRGGEELPGFIPSPLSVLPFLSAPISLLSFAPLRPIRLQSAAGLPQGRLRVKSSSSMSPCPRDKSTLRPFAPWSPLPFRFTARLFIFLFVVQAGMFSAPVQVRAETLVCEETFYPLTDNLGTVNLLTDHAGAVVLRQHFLPFGEDFENPKSTVATCNGGEPWPYGFTGQYHDKESGLIYFHARYYNPAIGHFMSADSVVPNPQDTFSYDRYGYCRNNPINLTDPTGHTPLIGAIVGAIVGAIIAAVNGQNVLKGALIGAIAGMMYGAAGASAYPVANTMLVGAVMGAISAEMNGGNMLRGAIVGAVGAGIGAGFSGAGVGYMDAPSMYGQSVLAVMSGGIVGGFSNAAMGGDFWKGFTQGAAAAGLSFAANAVAGEIVNAASARSLAGGDAGGISADEVEDPYLYFREDDRNHSLVALKYEYAKIGNLEMVELGTIEGNEVPLSDQALGTMAETIVMLYSTAPALGMDRHMAVAIGMMESRLGMWNKNNPLQLKDAAGRYRSNTRQQNIEGAIGVWNEATARGGGDYEALMWYRWGKWAFQDKPGMTFSTKAQSLYYADKVMWTFGLLNITAP